MREIDQISGDVLDMALRLHRDLGPGLLESVYETVLAGELAALGYRVVRQRSIELINFGGATLKEGVRRIVNDHRVSASPREPN